MKIKLLKIKSSGTIICLFLTLSISSLTAQNLMLNPSCDDHILGSTSDNADAYDMTPNNTIVDETGATIDSPYQAIWDNDPLEDWLELYYLGSSGSLDEQPGTTGDGRDGTRGVKLYMDTSPNLPGQSSRRIYQKVIGITAGLQYNFSVDSRSEASGTTSEVYLLNTEISSEEGINTNGENDSSVDGFMLISDDYDTWATNSVTFTASTSFVVVYIRSLGSVDYSTEVFYDNFSLVEQDNSLTPPTNGQVIGEFPEMDGGMENQTADSTMNTAGGSQAGTPSTTWTVSSSSNAAVRDMTNDATLARTGNFSAAIAVTVGTNNLRLQSPSPTDPTIQTDTEYTVQYFYSAAVDPANDLDAGIYLNNTSGGVAGNTTDQSAFVPNTYTKTYRTITTGSLFNPSCWAVARLDGDDNGYTDTVRIDDFVIYSGAYDSTSSSAPTQAAYSNESGVATVSWSPPSDGVDGGGYVVLKYTSSPNDDNDPNQNGIYEHGNTTNNGTDSLVGTVVFVGTETSFTDTYQAGNFYKIYAVDKAFNYSNEAVVSDAQLGLTDYSDLELKLFPNPTHSIFNIYINESEFDITIYDILGQMVLKSKNSKTINISNFKTGAYFVKISTNKGSLTKKIIKQ